MREIFRASIAFCMGIYARPTVFIRKQHRADWAGPQLHMIVSNLVLWALAGLDHSRRVNIIGSCDMVVKQRKLVGPRYDMSM
jgi:hypothetical protein